MFITREMDYVLRILRALYRNGQMSARAISEMETISMPITYKTLDRMARAGLVTSRRGVDGGYMLVESREPLSLYDVLKAMGADLLVNRCLDEQYRCEAWEDGAKQCGLHRECCRIQMLLETELKRKTLSEIFKE